MARPSKSGHRFKWNETGAGKCSRCGAVAKVKGKMGPLGGAGVEVRRAGKVEKLSHMTKAKRCPGKKAA